MTDQKRLLFVNQHYYPDVAATGQKLTDLAEYLAGRGYEVTVLCSQGQYLSGDMKVPAEEIHRGVQIIRLGATSFGRATHLKRLLDYASFYIKVFLKLLTGPRYSYTIWLTTPPLLSVAGAMLLMLRRQPYGIWSMDLHPDAEEALGLIRPGGILSKLLHALNNWGYRKADFVVDLGKYMKARILGKGVALHRTHTVPMWDRLDGIRNLVHENNSLRYQLGLQDKFVVMYSGNAGLAHRFDEVLEAMRSLKDHPDICFLFVGDGPRKVEIIDFVRMHQIKNFHYLDYFPRNQLGDSLAVADVHLLTLRKEMAGIAVPCKLFGIMATARPAVMIGPEASEPAAVIMEEHAGIVVDPARYGSRASMQLVDTLLDLYKKPELCRQYGKKGAASFKYKFNYDTGCEAWLGLVGAQESTIVKTYA